MRFPAPARLGGLTLFLLASSLFAQSPAADEEAMTSAARPTISVPLTRGAFDIFDLPPSGPSDGIPAKAIIVFASDSGGWTYWEDRVGHHLAKDGYYVLGLDLSLYAAHRYTQETIAADFERIAEAAPTTLVAPDAPIYFAGYGMGAAQAVAAASLTPQPPRLAGLIVVALPQRGRYGVNILDTFFQPRGSNTFAMADLAPKIATLRTLQLRSPHGWLESTTWLDSLPSPHQLINYPQSWREFRHANATFLKALDKGLSWLIVPPAS